MIAAAALVAIGCDHPDPRVLDRSDLKSALSLDEATAKTLGDADRESRAGHEEAAVDILKRTSEPAAKAAFDGASSVAARTAWGKKQKTELVALVTDRKNAIDEYEVALESHVDELVLASMNKQIEIERRARTLFTEVDHGVR